MAEGSDAPVLLGRHALCHYTGYRLIVQAEGGAGIEYDWVLDAQNDLDPRLLYQEANH